MNRLLVRLATAGIVLVLACSPGARQPDSHPAGYSAEECPSCAGWNAPASPARLYGNAYYVGTSGLSAVLLTGDEGHVLLDAGLPESAPQIISSIQALGFDVEDVKLIVNSHAHYDHAGGIAALQRASGAEVAASRSGADVIRRGTPGPDDPQYDIALPFPAVHRVRAVSHGETLSVGSIALTAHLTAGHTPGGMSWSWESCEEERCLAFVYADSQTPVSADGFSFTRSSTYPTAIQDFERAFAVLEQLRCDVLITPHPGASRLWERLEARAQGNPDALEDPEACRRYAASARERLARRIAAESAP